MDSHSCELFRIILLVSFTTVFKPGADVVRLPSIVGRHVVDVPELLLPELTNFNTVRESVDEDVAVIRSTDHEVF
jgi:hypothetical protein